MVLEVKGHADDRRGPNILHDNIRQPLEPIGLLIRKRLAGKNGVDFTGFEGNGPGRSVGDDLEDHTIQKRTAFLEVVFVAHEGNVTPFDPLLELKRPSANGIVRVERILKYIRSLIKMLGHDATIVRGEGIHKGEGG